MDGLEGWSRHVADRRRPRQGAALTVTAFPRDVLRDQCVYDPGIVHGPFRVLQRTDGLFVVCDTQRPPAHWAVSVLDAIGEAEALALALAEAEGHASTLPVEVERRELRRRGIGKGADVVAFSRALEAVRSGRRLTLAELRIDPRASRSTATASAPPRGSGSPRTGPTPGT